MKKTLRLLAVAGACWLAPAAASAQYYLVPFINAGSNPGGLNTDDEVTATQLTGWTTVLTGTPATRTNPIWSPTQSLPFPFTFNGQAVQRFRVATSGVLSFDTVATAVPGAANAGLPSADVPNNSICVWGLTMGAADYLITKTFGTAPNRQFWVQFNSASQGTSTAISTYWSIVLQETTNTIFIVDQRTVAGSGAPALSLTLGVQFSATQSLQVGGSPNLNSRTTTTANPRPDDNTYYMFEPGAQPAADMTIRAVTVPTQQGANIAIPVTGTVRNIGSQAVTSYQLGYSINGGAPMIDNVTGVTVGPLGVTAFTHSVPFTPTTGGLYTLKIWATMPNGLADPKPFNDTTTRKIEIADSAVQRTVLVESFSSSTCGPCTGGNINVRAVLRNNPGKAIKIAYQQDFPARPGDPYHTAESIARFQYYNGSYVPYMMLDGGWEGNSIALNSNILNQFYNVPSFVSVTGSMTRTGNTIDATATVTPYIDLPAGMLCHMVITEKHTRNNVRTNGETDFYNVMKKMMPDQNGTSLPSLVSRQSHTVTQSYTFPTGNTVEHFDSLEVVIFVQDPITKQVMNSVTYNQRVTSLADEVVFGALSVAPNPAAAGLSSVRLTLPSAQLVSADVLDALGRVVATVPAAQLGAGSHELPIQLNAAASGLYIVRVTTGAMTRARRLLIE